MSMIRTHRFALSISGGIALGSYEAGVLTQLYKDIWNFNGHPSVEGKACLKIDAVAGASAGSITGLILTQAISLGLTPDILEERMRTCWVQDLAIENLLAPSTQPITGDAVFTDEVIQKIREAVLEIPPKPTEGAEEITLWITMTNLDGIPFSIRCGTRAVRVLHKRNKKKQLSSIRSPACTPRKSP